VDHSRYPVDLDRIRSGDLTGLNIAGLIRLSFEADLDAYSARPTTGGEINNRLVQEKAIRHYVTVRGGTYLGSYDEPDTSAFKKRRVQLPNGRYIYRVIRPVFQGALDNLKDGIYQDGETRLDGLAVYDQDRLVRDPRELEDCIEAVQYWGRPILDIRGSLDLLTDSGRQAARHIVVANNAQSAATARRLRDSHHARAQAGIPVGGRRCFGWVDRHHLDPTEAKLGRDALYDLILGVPANTVCRKWNQKRIRTAGGSMWERPALIAWVNNPRLAGWQVYRGKIALDGQGQRIVGQHEPLVDDETWAAAVEAIKPKRTRTDPKGKRVYLLSGIVRCGLCGRKLYGSKIYNNRPGKKSYMYFCIGRMHPGGTCKGVSGAGPAIDRLVTELVLAYLSSHTIEIKEGVWEGQAALDLAEAKIEELMAAYDNDELPGAYVFPRVRKKEAEIAELRREHSEWLKANTGPTITGVASSWPGLDLEQRRAIIETVVEAVVLKPATRQGLRAFDAHRLDVVWRM